MPTTGSVTVGRVVIVVLLIILIGWFFSRQHVAVAPVPGVSTQTGAGAAQSVIVKGAVGGEKMGYLADPQVVSILKEKYGITVEPQKEGSIDMVKGSTQGMDFLWPSSQVALEIYKEQGGDLKKSATIFSSPIVMYSWTPVTDALIKAQVVRQENGSYYVIDLQNLVKMINDGTQWSDIGLPDLYGRISVRSTDPNKSNSGMMFAGLMANIECGNGGAATDSSLKQCLPSIRSFFGRLGYMEGSSGDLFDQFITQGEGENPIMVGYENQLTEYTLLHEDYRATIEQEITIMYPRPTVWSDHPLIALTDNGVKLLNALHTDPELRKIAWEGHGFRTGFQNDPKTLAVTGIPATINNVVPMPEPSVVDHLLSAIAK